MATAQRELERESIDRLAAQLRGDVIGPGDPAYDEARMVWNASVDRHPALVARCAGSASVSMLRCMSHMSRRGSSSSRESSLRAQRCPQVPRPMMIGRSSSPAGVRWYSGPRRSEPVRRSTMPACSSSRMRLASRLRDISGTPRCRSLKRWLPHSSSRTTRGVHRSASTSLALATGQNWP